MTRAALNSRLASHNRQNTGLQSANQVEVDFILWQAERKEAVDLVDRINLITRMDREFSEFRYPILAIRYPFLVKSFGVETSSRGTSGE
jgi:hypothetical protein